MPLLPRKLTCPLNNLLAQRFYKFRRCSGKETFAHLKEKLGRQKAIKRIVCAFILSALKVALWHYTKELFLTFPSLIYTWNDLYYLYTSYPPEQASPYFCLGSPSVGWCVIKQPCLLLLLWTIVWFPEEVKQDSFCVAVPRVGTVAAAPRPGYTTHTPVPSAFPTCSLGISATKSK